VSKTVKEYAENKSVCRRSLLYRDFLFSGREKIISCKCCDLCMPMCNCSECKIISYRDGVTDQVGQVLT